MANKRYIKDKSGNPVSVATNNLQLEKPLVNENYNIDVHNRNMDKIDEDLSPIEDSYIIELFRHDGDTANPRDYYTKEESDARYLSIDTDISSTADKITITDATNKFEATNVEDALLENKISILDLSKDLIGSSERLASILTSKKLNSTASEGLKPLIEKVDLLRPAIVPGLIYDNGDECIETSGGFKVVNGTGNCKLDKLSDKMRLSCSATGNIDNGISTVKKINITDYSKLKFNLSLQGGFKGLCMVGLSSMSDSTNINIASANITSGGITELNVSNLSGEYYVVVKAYYQTHLTHTNTIDVLKIWAEV